VTKANRSEPAAPRRAHEPQGFGHALEWRGIGPFRGGRVVAVAGDPSEPLTFYFGSTGGGVWKTTDGGLFWENVSDGFFQRASVGGLAVAPSDPNVIYAGMGEATIRGNVSHGDGVYKSVDAGKTWTHLGLAETRNIGRVRVHPDNPDVVYVAALGHAHGPNRERGIFRSRDGGKTWEHVLFRREDVGANELSLDPTNPRILYAAFWRARRLPHALDAGGDGCGIFRSTDGGDTWTDLTRKKGMPTGDVGKFGIVASPAKAGRVWAIVEAADGAVLRSDDGGETWERLCDDRGLRQRPWYYQHLHADPRDPKTVWVLNVRLWQSTDGGRTFARRAIPHGDNHDLWIDPRNPRRMIEGNDGGACVTFDGGETWSSIFNQPTAEFYHVTTDNQTPYRIYGAQQDNSTISVPSRSAYAAILPADYREIGGGESGYIAVRADDPNIVYAGSYQGYLSRFDARTNQRRDVTVWPEQMIGWPAKDSRYRFQWTFPILLSPHDPNVLYTTGNRVFRSTDEGASWETISPDLTRHDETRLQDSGGPVTLDNCGTEYYATIFALAESPVQSGLLWAGSDDGLVHVSRDHGQSWQNVTPKDLPEWALISIIEPSPHDAGTAYVAAHRYKLDDFQPYLFKTSDYGAHWTPITDGLPGDVFARAIREDSERRGLLFAGTETGIWVSFDDGQRWESLQLNLPVVPIHDLVIKGTDLIVATHGRSFWILDDLTPLRQMRDEMRDTAAHLFSPRPTIKVSSDSGGYGSPPVPGINYQHTGAWVAAYREIARPNGDTERAYLDAGQNPKDGVYVTYWLKEKPAGEVTLTFLDAEGREIKSFSSEEHKRPVGVTGDERVMTGEQKLEKTDPRVPTEPGMNRFVWDMRYPEAATVEGFVTRSGVLDGPSAPPGRYQARLSVAGQTLTAWLEIQPDPRVAATQADLEAQFALLLQIRDKVTEVHEAVGTLRGIRRQVEEWERRSAGLDAHEKVARAASAITEQLSTIEDALIQVRAMEDDDTLRFPTKLNFKLADLYNVVASADAAPTRQAREVFADLAARADQQTQRLRAVLDADVKAFDALIRDAGIPAIARGAVAPPERVARSFAGRRANTV
jgi:photosystem II stability/assembly factor-like uncharacterized protein